MRKCLRMWGLAVLRPPTPASLCTPEAGPHDGIIQKLPCLGFRLGLANGRHCQEEVGLEDREMGLLLLYFLPALGPSGIQAPARRPSSNVPNHLGIHFPVSSSCLFKHKGGGGFRWLLISQHPFLVLLTPPAPLKVVPSFKSFYQNHRSCFFFLLLS